MQDRPTAAELVEAAREFLERDVMPAVDGRIAFHTRVTLNVLATVQRELELGVAQDQAQRQRLLALLGHANGSDHSTRDLETELAALIRDDALPHDLYQTATDHIRETVREKLLVANPKYLDS